ncbi:hypothetical protein ACOMHN_029639 [Nucella lapillus]
MVMADKTTLVNRNGKRSRGPSPSSEESDISEESERGTRIGDEFQAEIPNFNPSLKYDSKHDGMLVWAPGNDLSDAKVDEYTKVAKDIHGYNTEQALGMLFWHKHNVDRALADLGNFTPFPDEWTVEDKVLFEQAYNFHGKQFHRIHQMLPDKSIPSLVKHFYMWKKTRTRTSLMDRQARSRAKNGAVGPQEREDGGAASDASSDRSAHDMDMEEEGMCRNCRVQTPQLHATNKGSLCSPCYQHWRRTGEMRVAGTRRHESLQSRHNPIKHKRRPPKGMFLDIGGLQTMVTTSPSHTHTQLKALDADIASFKRQVQNNKQMLCLQKHKLASGVNEFKPAPLPQIIKTRWSNEELLLAVQGVRKYGRNFRAIAEVIGTKLEVHVRAFFHNFRRRYNLDEVLAEYEAEHGAHIVISDHEETPPTPAIPPPSSSLPASQQLGQEMDGRDTATAVNRTGSHVNGGTASSISSSSSHPLPPPLLPQSTLLGPAPTAAITTTSTTTTPARLAVPQKTVLQQPPPLIRPPASTHSSSLPPHASMNAPLH